MEKYYTICHSKQENLYDYICKHSNKKTQYINLENISSSNDRFINKYVFFTNCKEDIKKFNELDDDLIKYNLEKQTFDFICKKNYKL